MRPPVFLAPPLLARPLLAPLLLAPLLLGCPKTSAPTTGSASTRASNSPLVEVETIRIDSHAAGEDCRFNDDLPWVVSLHRGVVRESELDGLERAVVDAGLERQVILDWFGSDAPARVELILGRDLPVPLATALVALARDSADGLPVVVSAGEEDSELCHRARGYLGSLIPTEVPVTDDSTLQAMESAQAGAAFWSLVPPSGR